MKPSRLWLIKAIFYFLIVFASTHLLTGCTPVKSIPTSAAAVLPNRLPTIDLIYTSPFPGTPFSTLPDLEFIDKVMKDSRGRVYIRVFSGGSLINPDESYPGTTAGHQYRGNLPSHSLVCGPAVGNHGRLYCFSSGGVVAAEPDDGAVIIILIQREV